MNGKYVIDLFPCVRPGIISKIEGLEEIKNNPKIVSISTRYNIGEEVGAYYNVNQRFAEIDIVCDDRQDLKDMIDYVYNTLIIKDEKGNDMLFAKIDTAKLLEETKGVTDK